MYTHEFWARESRLSGNMFIWCTCVHTDQMQACIIIALFWVTYRRSCPNNGSGMCLQNAGLNIETMSLTIRKTIFVLRCTILANQGRNPEKQGLLARTGSKRSCYKVVCMLKQIHT